MEAVKRLDRLAPNLVHVDSSGNGHRLNTIRSSIPQGHLGGLGGHKFKRLGKLSNGWTDWHRIWYTSADSSGNGHRLNAIRPSIPQGHLGGGGFRGSQIQDWHQIGYTSVDSSENGLRLKTIRPTIPHGGILVFYMVNNSKDWEMWSNGWTD